MNLAGRPVPARRSGQATRARDARPGRLTVGRTCAGVALASATLAPRRRLRDSGFPATVTSRMRVSQQAAFILHARSYRETSLLIEAFTRDHGRVGLVARGVRRERSRLPRGLLQPLQPLLLDWIGQGELATLTAAEAAGGPLAVQGEALLAAMYVNELMLRLSARQDASPGAFAAYLECLTQLSGGIDLPWTLRRFERDLLAELGYGLALAQCADGTPVAVGRDYAYDPDSGPLPWCEPSPFVRVAGAALLALERDEPPVTEHLSQLRRMVRAVIRRHLGAELKSWTLVQRGARSPHPRR